MAIYALGVNCSGCVPGARGDLLIAFSHFILFPEVLGLAGWVAALFFRFLARGLLARLAGYAAVGLGFWLLYLAFGSGALVGGIALGIAGAAFILAGMFLMVSLGRARPDAANHADVPGQAEDSAIDPVHGRNKGG